MDVKHAAARKSFELAFSGVYKYINLLQDFNINGKQKITISFLKNGESIRLQTKAARTVL